MLVAATIEVEDVERKKKKQREGMGTGRWTERIDFENGKRLDGHGRRRR